MPWLIVILALLAGCGSEEPAPRAESKPACVPDRRICGLAPPRRGTSYKVTTVTGASFWVTLPAELADAGVVAVPHAPMRLNASLTTAGPREAADRFCDQFPACEPIAVSRDRALVRWDDASGTIRDLEVTTLDLGAWTLVLLEPDAGKAETVARAVTASVGRDGYPLLNGPVDAGSAGVMLWVGHHLVDVMPGCADGGTRCSGGRYRVDVHFADRPTAKLLHEELRIVPD